MGSLIAEWTTAMVITFNEAPNISRCLDRLMWAQRILLVEDEILIGMLATQYLEDAGFEVESAVSAMDAMNRVRLLKDEISAAIIDIGLPDRKGDVLVSELRAIYPALGIVIATGHGERQLRERFRSDERVTFLDKPYTQEGLLAAVRSLL